ncbi:MAG: superoxide dismutase family protein [Bauldia sp.]|nr:superoxide dismutase family protein [Bauldia sp.]
MSSATRAVWLLGALAAAVPASAQQQPDQGFVLGPPFAATTLETAEGAAVATVTMTSAPTGLLVRVEFNGMRAGTYALHVHETGACTPDFEAAGGHFNPTDAQHGFLAEGGPHLGDLPNVTIPESGIAIFEFFAPGLSVDPGPPPAGGNEAAARGPGYLFDEDGAAMLIHAMPDDYLTEPAGDAGERFACGVLQLAQP